jgi:hypothetical protein
MGLDQYGQLRNTQIDFEKYYNDKNYDPTKDGFVWRKHARLQVFMAREYKNQNPKEKTDEHSGNIDGLGFNGDDHKVIITKDVVKRLEDAIKNDYWDYFATDGFFWGQQFQEEQVKEYKKYDKQFLKFCKDCLKKDKIVEYSCSW